MKRAVRFAFWFFLVTVRTHGQQIGSVDLTHPPILDESEERLKGPFLPNGCVKSGGAIGDGAIVPKKNQPHEITVEVTSVSYEEPTAGSTMQAVVRLRNSGIYPIEIPWNTDPNAVKKIQTPNHLAWEVGNFHILLDRNNMKNLGQSLYGSKLSRGSILTVRPGEWVTAVIKFKLDLEYPTREQVVRAGKRQLRVEWEQASYTEMVDLKQCEQRSGYFTYRNFYQQKTPIFSITIKNAR